MNASDALPAPEASHIPATPPTHAIAQISPHLQCKNRKSYQP
ncbi:hypothetical protein [Microcoleus sp. bin38.metabat.b11b12b14.051]|nr:hypothetical protein [Microcoleus sp. bin38.metabat.b11b12b14.051]